jgi:hypothetical protein
MNARLARGPLYRAPGLLLLWLLAVVSTSCPCAAQTEDECIAANERAVALRRTGKLIEARKELTVCAAAACPDVIRTSCGHRVAEVSSAIPGIRLEAKDENGNDLSDVVVHIDGLAAAEHLNGGVINLDPGSHDFVFERPGRAPVTRRFVLQEGEQARSETIVMNARGAGPPGSEAPIAQHPGGAREAMGASPGSPLRTWGLALGIAGAVAMTGGVAGGFAAKSYYDTTAHPVGGDPECSIGGTCTADGVNRQHTAHDWANVCTAVFIGGAVLGASGITLFVIGASSRARRESSIVLVPTPIGAFARGTW